MKNLTLGAILTLTATIATAGSGGYTVTNCMSESSRTIVSVHSGYEAAALTLIIDGMTFSHVSDVYSDAPDNGLTIVDKESVFQVLKNNSPMISLVGKGAKRELRVQAGADPRLNTSLDYVAKSELQVIAVSCKSYTKDI